MPDIENLLNIEDEVTQVLSDLGVNEKLNEMDDFMNQNDLKVQITNENAVVTGLVTYTCTVKDKNNTALANKVVEWYKGTTLIGIDATDSNGVSTFSHRVTEADIYDVHAIVRGTHAGDDIRMFVKDKDNLYSINLWSGGELNNSLNPSEYVTNGSFVISEIWSNKGNKSIKLNGNWIRFPISITSEDVGKTATVKAKVFVPNETVTCHLMLNDSSASSVVVPSSELDRVATVELTTTITEDKDYVKFNVLSGSVACYIDSVECYIS